MQQSYAPASIALLKAFPAVASASASPTLALVVVANVDADMADKVAAAARTERA